MINQYNKDVSSSCKCLWKLVYNGLEEDCTIGGGWDALNAVSDHSAFKNITVRC